MRTPQAIAGSALFFIAAPCVVAGLVPWLLTDRYHLPLSAVPGFAAVGAILIVAAAALLLHSFARFALEGLGTPAPVAPTERLVVGGIYRHVRNPMYVAVLSIIFGQALPQSWHFIVLLISTAGQLFCTTACLTSASRMTFAFSRDGAIPGSRMLSKVNPTTRIPANAVIFVAVVGALITLPALIRVDINGAPVPVAFYAVVSVAVIGLYLAFLIPIYLRWRMGDAFVPGSWTLGSKYKWMNPIAVAEIAIICIYFILPFTPAAVPGNADFSWKFVNYAPILTIGTLVILAIWWHASAKHWFTGPKHTIDEDVVKAFDD